MRSYEEMMELMLKKAEEDERIRAFTMEGSHVNPESKRDRYSDFDICYVVQDIREFTREKTWVSCFGEILVMQCPEDWYAHPYDYDGKENFVYLMQFADGNRIDLTLIDVSKISAQRENREPRVVLVNKDGFPELKDLSESDAFFIRKPSEQEYWNTCNEFRWVSLYVSKGLLREEFYYAKHLYETVCVAMLVKMVNWKIGIRHQFQVSSGAYGKYFKRFLSTEEMERFQGIFPGGTYEEMWEKLFLMQEYFEELAKYVGESLGFAYDEDEGIRVMEFQRKRKDKSEMTME